MAHFRHKLRFEYRNRKRGERGALEKKQSSQPASQPSFEASVPPASFERKKQKEGCVKNSLSMIVLSLLKEEPRCGYDILAYVHKNFNVLLSPGTLYPILYALEKEGIIKNQLVGRKKVYALNGEGSLSLLNELADIHDKILSFVKK